MIRFDGDWCAMSLGLFIVFMDEAVRDVLAVNICAGIRFGKG